MRLVLRSQSSDGITLGMLKVGISYTYRDRLLDDLCFFFFLCSLSLSFDFFDDPILQIHIVPKRKYKHLKNERIHLTNAIACIDGFNFN